MEPDVNKIFKNSAYDYIQKRISHCILFLFIIWSLFFGILIRSIKIQFMGDGRLKKNIASVSAEAS